MPVAKPDRDLTVGQYRSILKTFGRIKRKRPPEGQDGRDMLYNLSDYYDNVSKDKLYDHGEYMKYLFENKDVPNELLKMVPKLKY